VELSTLIFASRPSLTALEYKLSLRIIEMPKATKNKKQRIWNTTPMAMTPIAAKETGHIAKQTRARTIKVMHAAKRPRLLGVARIRLMGSAIWILYSSGFIRP